MDRRNFLRSLVGGVTIASAVRTFPFRVFSFPSEIVVQPYLTKEALRRMIEEMKAKSIMPFNGKRFYGYVHPFAMKDLVDKHLRHIELYRYKLRAA